jgi:hypothetical protein
MSLPSLSYSRADGNTGSARSAPIGIIAVIAASASGTVATPTSATSKSQVLTGFGHGELPELTAHILDVGNKPVVVCKVAASTVGSYGTIATAGAPVSTPSVITAGTTKPLDRFRVIVQFLTAGVIGVTGITFRWSLDNGATYGATTALGTAVTLVIPDTNITLALAAGGVAVGETVKFTTRGPAATLADLTPCLDALKATGLTFEAILIGSIDADATAINGIRTALNGFMSRGLSKRAFVNVRPYDPSTETAQAYTDALTVGADGGYLPSPIRGISMWRPTALALAARVAKISLGTDAAYVGDGPVDGFSIVDSDGNSVCWDEAATPGLDDLGFVTLRTFARRAGCFIGNPRVFSPVGSDFVFDQQERCMCAAEERSFDFLTERLSARMRKDPILGPQGQVYLLEAEAAELERSGTLDLMDVLRKEVDGVRLTLSRVDDVGANSGAIVTASIKISSLVYLKGFAVTTQFVRSFNV